MQGCIKLFVTCLSLDQPQIAIETVENLCADRLCRRELADQGVIPLILSLL